jgi:hypothetical protein
MKATTTRQPRLAVRATARVSPPSSGARAASGGLCTARGIPCRTLTVTQPVEIRTGGDPFHAPARALYESLGGTQIPEIIPAATAPAEGDGSNV